MPAMPNMSAQPTQAVAMPDFSAQVVASQPVAMPDFSAQPTQAVAATPAVVAQPVVQPQPVAQPQPVVQPQPVAQPDPAREYYNSVVAQGHTPENALAYTKQYFPEFQG